MSSHASPLTPRLVLWDYFPTLALLICPDFRERALSQIFRFETGAFRYPRKHSRTDFISIVEGKDIVGPFRAG